MGHYFVARIHASSSGSFSLAATVEVFDSLPHTEGEPLNQHAADVLCALVGPRLTVVWDFDHSLIDDNSDTWIPEQFGFEWLNFIETNRRPGQWTALMAETARKMHEAGISLSALRTAAARLPVDMNILQSIRELDAGGVTQHILSDANSFYIKSFFEAHEGFCRIFKDRIVTNPTEVDCTDCLVIRPYVDTKTPHGCAHCPINLCKGAVLRSMLMGRSPSSRVIYVGDGSGDICPVRSALEERDLVLARAGYPLARSLLQTSPAARVFTWIDGGQLHDLLLQELRTSPFTE
jgi:pyridoxal phosphate phosphatase PHOSPHO2